MRLREFDEKERLLKANEKLTKYKTDAGADAAAADAAGNFARGHKRFKGINAATIKQFDNDAKLAKLKDLNKQGVAENAELKKRKRAYNQAAKDANADQVGAGKKIDTMKNSLRQKDINKQSVAEGMRKWLVIHSGSHGEGGKMTIDAPDFEAAWKLANEYDLDIIDIKPVKGVAEEWSQKYKNSINCSHPKGFSQKAHCAGKQKHNESIEMEMVCEDCGMCQTHGSLNEIKKGEKDSNGYTRCWPGKHAEGTKTGKNGGQVRNCVPNESIEESEENRCRQCGMINCKCPGDSCKCKPIAGWIPNKGFRKAAEQVDEDQLDELSKDTLRNYVRAQPARIKGPAGLATTNNKKAARIVNRDIPRALDKYKDPAYGQQGMAESNVFTDARMNAIKADQDTFVVHGKTYQVTGDTTDERQAGLAEDSLAAMRRLAGVTTPPAAAPNGPRQYRHMPTAVQPR